MSHKDIDQRIVKARAALITAHPFFGALALHLQPMQTTTYPRLATDGRHLFYNVEFLDTVSGEELKGIIAHEVYHCALKHHTRRNGRDPKEWNQATDFVINPMVLKAGLKLPNWVLFDPQYDGLSAEQVYRIRQQQRQQRQQEREAQAYRSQRGDHGEPSDDGEHGGGGEPKYDGDQVEPDDELDNDMVTNLTTSTSGKSSAAKMATLLATTTAIPVATLARNLPITKPIMPTPKPINMLYARSPTPTVTTSHPGSMILTGAVKFSTPRPRPMPGHLRNRKPNGTCGFARRSTLRRKRPEVCRGSSRPS
jgi:hypothetical protein